MSNATHASSEHIGSRWDLTTKAPPGSELLSREPKGRLIPSDRYAPENVLEGLGMLHELAGTWYGEGFNLIARPAFHYKENLYLQLNRTRETLKFDPIGSPIPNRGFGQQDIDLYGLTYLQKISDLATGSALHIEPGIWVRQPNTKSPPDTAPPPGELVARMGSIPHGNAILACGFAEPFSGPPTIAAPGAPPHGSRFYSFNSTPIGAPPTVPAGSPPVFSAAGSSEKATAAANPGFPVFNEYDLSVPDAPTNPRTPLDTSDPPLTVSGITQAMVNDPIIVLQDIVKDQVAHGYTFEGTVLNICTEVEVDFFKNQNSIVTGPTLPVNFPQFDGGAENILFLFENRPPATPTGNAETAVIYATFWIERVKHHHHGHSFMQLQYAQMVTLNFPVFTLLAEGTLVNLGWPHITVGTLRKGFG